jgi:Fic family protein
VTSLPPLETVPPERFDTPLILKKLASALQQLGELKGISGAIPNEEILINTLGLQEAKDSSAIENIVTTNDELFREIRDPVDEGGPAAKEVVRYARALRVGFEAVREHGLLTNTQILRVQQVLEQNDAGFRRLPGTALKNQDGAIIYTPPAPEALVPLMTDLERFINDDSLYSAHPLVKMALIHHRFEAIHPFYDGNGRTGRILNVLYLVKQRVLDIPVLYMSRHIIGTRPEYYRLLRAVSEHDAWEDWVLYMLTAIEETARDGIQKITAIRAAFLDAKHKIRERFPKLYSQDLLNTLFSYPYTRIQFVEEDLGISRLTAAKYLNLLADAGFLEKQRHGRSNYYVNPPLYRLLTGSATR